MASWDSGVSQRDALLSYGFRRANGMAFRSHLGQWWFDASSKAFGSIGFANSIGFWM